MSNSKFVLDKLAKLLEQGIVNYRDLSSEILNILKSKRDELIFKMRLTGKEDTDIIIKRLDNLEKRISKIEKNQKKTKKAKKL
tara:strand:- start:892 stop:1140 length:249 start_codon:yes stop_codon:yes gene_type:complete